MRCNRAGATGDLATIAEQMADGRRVVFSEVLRRMAGLQRSARSDHVRRPNSSKLRQLASERLTASRRRPGAGRSSRLSVTRPESCLDLSVTDDLEAVGGASRSVSPSLDRQETQWGRELSLASMFVARHR